ncbi:MAG: hypothetical protein C4321_02760 [Chloroflexota bacterium]
MKNRTTAAAVVLTLVSLLSSACVGGGDAHRPSSGADAEASTTAASDGGAATKKQSRLPDGACELKDNELSALSPDAPLTRKDNPDVLPRVEGVDVVLNDNEPFYLDVGATGTLVRCGFISGEGNSSADTRVSVVVVDFTGGVNEDPGPQLAKKAFAKIGDGLRAGKAGEGLPESVPGVGDEALRLVVGDSAQETFVARNRQVLVTFRAQRGDHALVLDKVQPIVSRLLADATTAVGDSGFTPTTTKASGSSTGLVTSGAVDATWVVRTEDIETAICGASAPPAAEIPLKSTDGTKVATLQLGRLFGRGDASSIRMASSAFSVSGRGGFTLKFTGDALHPGKATVRVDTTLHGDATSNPSADTTVRGSLHFDCP